MGELVKSTTKSAIHRRVSCLITGEGKVGKTTLALTVPVEKDSQLAYVAADPGQLRLRDRDFTVLEYGPKGLTAAWLDEVYLELRRGVSSGEYKWIFVDGIDDIGDRLLKEFQKRNTNGLKAYGEMADFIREWVFKVRDIKGASSIFTCHLDNDEADQETPYKALFPGKMTSKVLNNWFDLIGCLRIVKVSDNTNKRYLQFDRSVDPRFAVGDRSGVLLPYEEPNIKVIFDKIHNAGLVTEGEAEDMPKVRTPRSDDDMKHLGTLASAAKMTTKEVLDMSSKLYDSAPRYLTNEEYKELCNKVQAKGGI